MLRRLTSRHTSLAVLGMLLLILPSLGLGCKSMVSQAPVKLTYWRVFDDPDNLKDIIAAYRTTHPYVTIEVKKIRYEEYEQLLLDALAEDRGPDMFSIPNTWIGRYQSKLLPLPPSTTVTTQTIEGAIKKDIVSARTTTPAITTTAVRNQFVDAVASDVIRTGPAADGRSVAERIYGLPLALDTLALFSNRDILNAAGIPVIPQTWTDFLKAVSRITKFDDKGNILIAGAALGTSKNIPRAVDILAALMMQNGAVIVGANGHPAFHLPAPGSTDRSFLPGIEALRFYTDFASPTKEAYTWNADMPDALEAFSGGKVGFFFGYSYQLPIIRAQAPQLRLDITPLPQADAEHNTVNLANYWVEGVSKKTKHPNEAWDFIQFATKAEHVTPYLQATNKPTALRSLVATQTADPALAPFAGSLLTAKTWYPGSDPITAEQALSDLITETLVAVDPKATTAALQKAISRLDLTLRSAN